MRSKGSALGGRRTELPPAAVLAARLRAGATIDEIAAECDAKRQTVQVHLTTRGWSAETGEPFRQPRPALTGPPAQDLAWQADGLCAQTDPESFYPEKGGSTREAKKVCNGYPATNGHPGRAACPVREQCLKHALDNDERFGIWGGMSERDRRKLKKGTAA